jgi:two-component system KDP operon response regulator KdpE
MASAIEAVRQEAADYLLKPISMETLRTRVAEVLTRHRATQQRSERIRHMYQQLQALVADEGLGNAMPPAPQAAGAVVHAGPLAMDVQQHMVRMAGQPVELTPTEFAILHALVRQPGTVIPCTQLIGAFQPGQIDEDEARGVMRPHIVRLRRKIEPDPQRPTYILSVRGVGYRWGDAGEVASDDG